jgi:hypothetical protein
MVQIADRSSSRSSVPPRRGLAASSPYHHSRYRYPRWQYATAPRRPPVKEYVSFAGTHSRFPTAGKICRPVHLSPGSPVPRGLRAVGWSPRQSPSPRARLIRRCSSARTGGQEACRLRSSCGTSCRSRAEATGPSSATRSTRCFAAARPRTPTRFRSSNGRGACSWVCTRPGAASRAHARTAPCCADRPCRRELRVRRFPPELPRPVQTPRRCSRGRHLKGPSGDLKGPSGGSRGQVRFRAGALALGSGPAAGRPWRLAGARALG